MSDAVKQLEEQLNTLKLGLLKMSPRDRVRALSTHETDDLILDLQDVADDALKVIATLKS
ncbi:hypothetical protein [Reinekea sp. G2M2-21]|uniref:hypothetical protein n=1 Tax=Reinekea sp. G2M2-21 TaxID=2788942 RepID=UPI0018AA0CC1|nr:hypothetical protein [Reinekea sp. G2M2-21]